jgi:hypothetical protein
MLCSIMPRAVSDQCEDFVSKYGDMIIKLIVEAEMNPDEVCAALALCTETQLWGEILILSKCINLGIKFK